MYVGNVMNWFLPYCLKRQPDGRYAILNRKYHPIGCVAANVSPPPKAGQIDAKHLVRLPGMSAAVAALMSWNGSHDTEVIYLYKAAHRVGENEAAFAAYMTRLHLLMQMAAES